MKISNKQGIRLCGWINHVPTWWTSSWPSALGCRGCRGHCRRSTAAEQIQQLVVLFPVWDKCKDDWTEHLIVTVCKYKKKLRGPVLEGPWSSWVFCPTRLGSHVSWWKQAWLDRHARGLGLNEPNRTMLPHLGALTDLRGNPVDNIGYFHNSGISVAWWRKPPLTTATARFHCDSVTFNFTAAMENKKYVQQLHLFSSCDHHYH